MHIDIGETEFADFRLKSCEQALGKMDGRHAAGRTNCLRCCQRQGTGAGQHVQDLVTRRVARLNHQSIGAEGREPQGLAVGAFGPWRSAT